MAQVDLVGIKRGIKALLDSANTTTGSPIDLSQNMSSRVEQVLTVNPESIMIDGNNFPLVSIYTESKDVEQRTIAGNNSRAKMISNVTFRLVGSVYNDKYNGLDKDGADDNLEYLMENIEEIVRSDATLSNTVLLSRTSDVTYHAYALNEDNHLRWGVMNITVRADY